MDAFGKKHHSWMVVESMFYQVLNAVQWWRVKKKMFNGEIKCHLKRRLKRLCHYKWNTSYKLLSNSGLKKNCAHFYHPPVILFERSTKHCHWAPSCVAVFWKETNRKLTFLWKKINWHGLQIAKCHFSYAIWLMISEESITV